jgi:hypothetical protein
MPKITTSESRAAKQGHTAKPYKDPRTNDAVSKQNATRYANGHAIVKSDVVNELVAWTMVNGTRVEIRVPSNKWTMVNGISKYEKIKQLYNREIDYVLDPSHFLPPLPHRRRQSDGYLKNVEEYVGLFRKPIRL